ncbi:hypothetical protein MTO96_043904, partial [Rhipicephalus appendiculatus]
MKPEAWRRARLYSNWLKVVVSEGLDEWLATRRLQEFHRLSAQMTEFLWQKARLTLPSPRRTPGVESTVTVLGNIRLPGDIKDTLQKGPNFCFEPQTSRSELLTTVGRVGFHASDQARERAVGDSVDCLLRN